MHWRYEVEHLSEKAQIEMFKAAFEFSHDGIHILDKDGRTLYLNQACTRIEGLTEKEAKAKNIRELVEDGVYSESVTLIVLETSAPATIMQTAKNGKEILVTGTPIYKEGSVDKIIVNSRDITDLNTLKKQLYIKEHQTAKYKKEIEVLRKEQFKTVDIESKNTVMQKVIKLALTVAEVDSTVLITGESGVGKGVLSQFIHKRSKRQNGPYIKIDCSAIPETLFESELFGYERGAFTGAEKEGKVGLLELGNGGTVVLDEIGEMPLSMQPKILRAIQDREIVPVGSKDLRELDIRIIAATNMNLEKMVEEKLFREDLYYRLNVVPIHIPALRERPEDILSLISVVEKKINSKYGWNKKMSPEVINKMIRYSWPGNVRELENLIERLMVSIGKSSIETEDLPFEILDENVHFGELENFNPENYKKILGQFDCKLLKSVIEQKGSIAEAAKEIGVNVTTIRRKLNRYEEKG
jgi:PAS domain S-box-containing protein